MSAPAAVNTFRGGSLSLPRFAADVPASLDIWGAGNADAHLARALLDAGILRETDWKGDLLESLQAGLERWVNVECGCAGVKAVDVMVGITSDISEWNLEAQEWRDHYRGMALPVGAIGIEGVEFEYVYVERAVRAWEAKQKGLGWALLDLASATIAQTVGLASPLWAHNYLQDWGLGEEEEDDTESDCPDTPILSCEEDGFPNRKRLCASVPPEMIAPGTLYGSFEAAAEKGLRKRKLSSEDKSLLVDALDLYHLLPAARSREDFGDEFCFHEWEQVLSCGLRWNGDDAVQQIVDFYHDDLANSGMQSFFVYFRGFQFGSAKHTVANAFADVELCLQLLDGRVGSSKPWMATLRRWSRIKHW